MSIYFTMKFLNRYDIDNVVQTENNCTIYRATDWDPLRTHTDVMITEIKFKNIIEFNNWKKRQVFLQKIKTQGIQSIINIHEYEDDYLGYIVQPWLSGEDLSKQEMERILDALEREEQKVQEDVKKMKAKSSNKKVEKDW